MVRVNKPEYKFEMKKFEQFCELYQFIFPQEFVEYLKQYNDAELEPNYLDFCVNECGIRYFYGTSNYEYCDIWATYECYIGRMPDKCVPIADPDFGNQICMSLAKDTYGRIYFWDHETMDTDDGEECKISFSDMYEIAPSFSDLLDKLEDTPCIFDDEEEKPNFFTGLLNAFSRVNIKSLLRNFLRF